MERMRRSHVHRPRWGAALFLSAVLSFCGEDRAGNHSAPSSPAREPAYWTVDSPPMVEIGASFEPAAAALHRAHSPWLEGDRLYVANAQREIREIDLSGRLRRMIGRTGEGPGEFRLLWEFRPLPGKQFATFDISANRIQVLDSTGSFVRGADSR